MSTLHNEYLGYIINSFNSMYFCLIRACPRIEPEIELGIEPGIESGIEIDQ